MTITRILSIIRKEFIQISRDPRTLALTLLMPALQIFLLGYTAASDVRNVPLAVLDQSKSQQSRVLLDAYRATDYFTLAYEVDDEKELASLIDGGRAKTGLIIPPDYGDKIARGQTARVAFIIDGSDPTIANGALAAATLLGQTQSARMQVQRLSRQALGRAVTPAIEVGTQIWYNPDLISAYFMIPAIIGMLLQTVTVNLTASSIVREREQGTIEQLIVTPVRPWELLVGKLVPYALLGFGNVLEALIIGTVWFHVPIRGNLALLLALTVLFVVTSLSLGLLISTVARTYQESQTMAIFVQLPSFLLSGFIFPVAAMPLVLQWISALVPLKYFLIIARAIMLKGAGLGLLVPEIAALVVFGAITMVVAVSRFQKRLD